MAAAAGAVTGVWWMLIAVVARTGRAALDRALGPARFLFPRGAVRGLATAGAALLVLSLISGWLS
jgi:Na+/H+-translocating membrane pyrophosphatase